MGLFFEDRPRPLGTPSKIISQRRYTVPQAPSQRHFPEGQRVYRVKVSKKLHGIRDKDANGRAIGRYKLAPTVVAWLDANCRGEYRIYIPVSEIHIKVNFSEGSDAALFKMVWA